VFPHFSLGELVVLLVIVLLIFGPQRITNLASGLGKSVGAFRKGLTGSGEDKSEKKRRSAKP